MKPTLYVLAAGMGSRYGGLKQLDSLGPHGETIMDYSIYDAIQAGFGKIVFVIRKDFEQDFREKILSKYEGHIPVEVVFQSVDKLPSGFKCPEDRTKPWGPAHAVLMAKDVIKEPFAVINADDFYGRNSFEVIADFLIKNQENKGNYAMVGFPVGNTMTKNGGVSRGVCEKDSEGYLSSIVERKSISYNKNGDIVFTGEDGVEYKLDPQTPVSMNMWGFTPDYFTYAEKAFEDFLQKELHTPKAEQVIPDVIDTLITNKKATVKVLNTDSKWFGVTYAEDRDNVMERFRELHETSEYPETLFS